MTNKQPLAPLDAIMIEKAVADALKEDFGLAGDVTTNATVGANTHVKADIVARQAGILSGLDVALAAFQAVNNSVEFVRHKNDGDVVGAGDLIATVSGAARALLSAERVALNFVGRMSGIATLTHQYVTAVRGTKARIVDTRKTTPGLRAFEKYAVRCGGGANHRSGLFDAVLIKDNHIVAAGGVGAAIERAQDAVGHMMKIEVEVDTIDQLRDVIKYRVDAVLLDNMSTPELKSAVEIINGGLIAEASGGVNLETVASIAETGVDLISVGALTHSAQVFDIGLDFHPTAT